MNIMAQRDPWSQEVSDEEQVCDPKISAPPFHQAMLFKIPAI
jgi:hypothetical protein